MSNLATMIASGPGWRRHQKVAPERLDEMIGRGGEVAEMAKEIFCLRESAIDNRQKRRLLPHVEASRDHFVDMAVASYAEAEKLRVVLAEWREAKREYDAVRADDERLARLYQQSPQSQHQYGPAFVKARDRRMAADSALLAIEARLLAEVPA